MKTLIKSALTFAIMICISCQKSDFSEIGNTFHINSFKFKVTQNISKIGNIKIERKNKTQNTHVIDNDLVKLDLFKEIDTEIDLSNLNQVQTLRDISEIESTELSLSYMNDSNQVPSGNQNLIVSYQISNSEAKESMAQIYEEAIYYLHHRGLSNNDLKEILQQDKEELSEATLIPLAILIMMKDEHYISSSSASRLPALFGSYAHASMINDCAFDAFGLNELFTVIGAGALNSSISKALLKKAVRKIATRALGWVGAAIFVYEFGDCMNWW